MANAIKPKEETKFPCILVAEGNVHIKMLTPLEQANLMQNKLGYSLQYFPIPEFLLPENQGHITMRAELISESVKLQLIDHRDGA